MFMMSLCVREICQKTLTNQKYETKMYDYRRGKTVPFNVIGEAPVTSLFVITNKEVWQCTVKAQRPGYESYQCTRVVTELVSKEIIGQLYFFDGTEVVTIPIPSTGEQKPNTAVVKEIKYLHPETNAVLKYDGYLEFFEPEDSPHQGVFERLGRERVPGEGEVEDYQRDVFYRTEVPESFHINHHNPEDGHIFTDDQKPYGGIGSVEDRAM
ncbi:uncharacterized protein LOC120353626 [Nilaparvata lugens]|uniref:uncharacterized protein LOC120353626 n=1 Tax=Nilaparvata lugens TaxID=108931 RepID=UPI00193E7D3A|nr:uncharacterized protein LOC120353626 [Nilaparvata lugens]